MSKVQVTGTNVKTVISTNSHTFCWEVKNFSKLPFNTEVKSPTFHPTLNHEFQARLLMEDENYFYLDFDKISGSDIELKPTVSLMNNAGIILYEEIIEHEYIGTKSFNFMPDLSDSVIAEIISLPDDVLIFKCVMEFDTIETGSDEYKSRTSLESPSDDLSALSKDLQAMYATSAYTDVSLKVGDSIVCAHKFLLCARSSVFARMFETPMNEREGNVINITDLDPPVLKDLVSYLYTGRLDRDDFESVYALYYAADKYNVPSLRKTCVDVLLSKLDVMNASRALALADRHLDAEFKNSVIGFIKFHFNKVLASDAWDELVKSAPRLATEVISAWYENCKNKVTQVAAYGSSSQKYTEAGENSHNPIYSTLLDGPSSSTLI